ncbi:MAG: hypothetical protein HY764_00230 [Candidatus Portnoybacteria bacterium]|nr:hypothetical protein [Candidatus Portnoybacteria bacterium]
MDSFEQSGAIKVAAAHELGIPVGQLTDEQLKAKCQRIKEQTEFLREHDGEKE